LFAELYAEPSEKNVARFLINDLRNPASLLNSLSQARENVRTLRGIIPRQTVEYVNELYLFAKDHLSEPLSRTRRVSGLSEVPKFVQRIEGFMSANMLHDAHWSFFRIGNYIERADMTSRIIEAGSDNVFEAATALEPYSDIQWRSVLLSLDATQSFNTEIAEPIQQNPVLEFLVRNERLPRSLAYTLHSLRTSLRNLPRHERVLRGVNRLRALIATDFSGMESEEVRAFLDNVQLELAAINRAIHSTYFEFKPRRSAKQGKRK
jgi:uncharacterized alpha-E superfamily protein